MGTNYFAHLNPCKCCSHPERSWHICKSMRTFRAYGYDGPLGHLIAEAQHWWPVLLDERIAIVDEYGVVHDKEKFIAGCKERGPRELPWDEYQHGNYHRDVQGFVLYRGEFR